jgi:replicative DNA helicase
MTAGESLFIKILIDADTKSLVLVDFEWLEGDEIPMYNFITNYFKEYTKLPSIKLFKSKFSIRDISVEDEAAYFLDALRDRYVYVTLVDKVPKIIKDAKKSSKESLVSLRDLIAKLSATGKDTELSNYGSKGKERLEEYENRIVSGGITYLPTGDKFLDSLMFGYSESDLITIGGRPGTKKTWILIYLTLALDKLLGDYLKDRPLLFVSNEIGVSELMDRMDCMKYKMPYTDFLKGELDTRTHARYERGLKSKRVSNIQITTKCRHLADLELLVKLYRPAAIFLDGSYLMEPKMSVGWEKVTFITQNLKAIALSNGTPVINTTQSRRRSGTSSTKGPKSAVAAQDDFAFADSYSQDSDLAMLLYPKDDSKWSNEIAGIVAKGRSIDIEKSNFKVMASLTSMDFKFVQDFIDDEEEDEKDKTISY